jgi:hypothetical protein
MVKRSTGEGDFVTLCTRWDAPSGLDPIPSELIVGSATFTMRRLEQPLTIRALSGCRRWVGGVQQILHPHQLDPRP